MNTMYMQIDCNQYHIQCTVISVHVYNHYMYVSLMLGLIQWTEYKGSCNTCKRDYVITLPLNLLL